MCTVERLFKGVPLQQCTSGCYVLTCSAVVLCLQTGNPEVVADLYAPDGVLLPTVSNQVIVHGLLHNLALLGTWYCQCPTNSCPVMVLNTLYYNDCWQQAKAFKACLQLAGPQGRHCRLPINKGLIN